MALMPGTYNYWNPNANSNVLRAGGNYYVNSWNEVIRNMPRIAMIADWNNWNEETAIEQCTGNNGWKDYYGASQPDWYLQITKAYSTIFKTSVIPNGTYVRDESDPDVYLTNGYSLIYQPSLPHGKPVIVLPSGWLTNHGYSAGSPPERSHISGPSLKRPATPGLEQNYPNPFNPTTTIQYQLTTTSVVKQANNILPTQFAISQNYPNPFNPTTVIKYQLPKDSYVTLKLYDILGREIKVLVDGMTEAGSHEVSLDASQLASGMYMYKLKAGEFHAVKKLLLLR
jgi:hypothetical protein